jgi:hypothetical protein
VAAMPHQTAESLAPGPRLGLGLRVQRAGIWAGLAMVPLFFIGLGLIAHFIPPPAPGHTARQVAHMYAVHRVRIRIGVAIGFMSAVLLAPFFAVLTVQIRRIEGRHSTLAYIQMMMGACLVLVFIVPMFTWEAAAYRPERDVQVTQALNDLAWLPFVGIVSISILQFIVIGISILTDRRARPVYPRWAGYLNFWVAVGVVPGAFVVFAKHGPLGWNGVLAWWLIISCFFVWLCAMANLTLKAIGAQGVEERQAGSAPGDRSARTATDERIDALAAEVERLRSEVERHRFAATDG